jgi:hypothetical protein
MQRKRRTEEQIIAILKEREARINNSDLSRKHGISGANSAWIRTGGGVTYSGFALRIA